MLTYKEGYIYEYPRKHWWQLWKPSKHFVGYWVQIGNIESTSRFDPITKKFSTVILNLTTGEEIYHVSN